MECLGLCSAHRKLCGGGSIVMILPENWSLVCLVSYKWFCMAGSEGARLQEVGVGGKMMCMAGGQGSRMWSAQEYNAIINGVLWQNQDISMVIC